MTNISRRGLLQTAVAGAVAAATRPVTAAAPVATSTPGRTPQRLLVVMFDGFGTDYYDRSPMPTLKAWAKAGRFQRIKGTMPTVTNSNNAGVCCGCYPDEHGITANSYWDADAGQEQFMSDGGLLTASTLFQRAARQGVRSALVSAKQKTIPLLKLGTTVAIGSQQPPPEAVKRYGTPPDIYSADVNYWVWDVAIDLIKSQPKLGLIYLHTTDYPMHKYAPDAGESLAHLSKIDGFLKAAAEADPDLAVVVTADHGLNAKSKVWNLNKALESRGVPCRFAMSAERDQYPRHHSGYGGTAFVYLNDPADADKTARVLHSLKGVEEVLTRDEAARKYRLNPHRIGDLWVTADKDTVFGHSATEYEDLPAGYRSHGSAHELDIPYVVHNFHGKLPDPGAVVTSVDSCSFLYRG